jgi:acyl transferase domain-containing protein
VEPEFHPRHSATSQTETETKETDFQDSLAVLMAQKAVLEAALIAKNEAEAAAIEQATQDLAAQQASAEQPRRAAAAEALAERQRATAAFAKERETLAVTRQNLESQLIKLRGDRTDLTEAETEFERKKADLAAKMAMNAQSLNLKGELDRALADLAFEKHEMEHTKHEFETKISQLKRQPSRIPSLSKSAATLIEPRRNIDLRIQTHACYSAVAAARKLTVSAPTSSAAITGRPRPATRMVTDPVKLVIGGPAPAKPLRAPSVLLPPVTPCDCPIHKYRIKVA